MKKTTIFAVAAACGAFAFAVPDWNQSLNAAYPNPVYTITDAVVTQQLAVSGCKTLKTTTSGDITLYDNGSYVLYRDDWSPVALTGAWAEVASKRKNTFYMSFNTPSVLNLFAELDNDATANCQAKYPALTYVSILQPSVLIKKNTIVVKVKNKAAKGTLRLIGKQSNDSKGVAPAAPVVGSVKAKVTLAGTLFVVP